jgi:hypothetical protein
MMIRPWLPALLLGIGGTCADGRTDLHQIDLQPPPGFSPPAPLAPGKIPLRVHRNFFQDGFSRLEQEASTGKTWRWMGQRGVIHLPAAGRPMVLRLTGWVPLELHSAPPRVRFFLNQRALDSFVPSMRNFHKEYVIDRDVIDRDLAARPGAGAARLALVIEVSAVGHAAGDPRELGLAISSVDWQPASAVAP